MSTCTNQMKAKKTILCLSSSIDQSISKELVSCNILACLQSAFVMKCKAIQIPLCISMIITNFKIHQHNRIATCIKVKRKYEKIFHSTKQSFQMMWKLCVCDISQQNAISNAICFIMLFMKQKIAKIFS